MVLTGSAGVAGWRRGWVALSAFTLISLMWLLAVVLFATDYRDADGAFDCWPNCTALQDAVGFALLVAPIMVVALLASAGIAGLLRRRSH